MRGIDWSLIFTGGRTSRWSSSCAPSRQFSSSSSWCGPEESKDPDLPHSFHFPVPALPLPPPIHWLWIPVPLPPSPCLTLHHYCRHTCNYRSLCSFVTRNSSNHSSTKHTATTPPPLLHHILEGPSSSPITLQFLSSCCDLTPFLITPSPSSTVFPPSSRTTVPRYGSNSTISSVGASLL